MEGDVSDWVVNLNTLSLDTDHGKIHSGFYNAYLAMKPQIDQALKGTKISTFLDYGTQPWWSTCSCLCL